ncbi:MAG: GGDEF domain-containing protein [Micromonosporaceae bacterium]
MATPAVLALRCAWSRLRSLRADLADLRRQATHDALTGLLNRAGFTDRATALVASPPVALVVALVDLDGFKQINDQYGHGVGDVALMATAGHLRRVCGPDGFASRLGGDEFVVVLPATEAGERLTAISHGLRVQVTDDVTVTVAGSVGAAFVTAPADLTTVLAHADAAMYRAKQAGGGVAFHDAARDDDTATARPLVRTRDLSAVPVLKAVA